MATLVEHPSFAEGPSPYHFGQVAVQSRVGVRDRIESLGRRVIRKYMNDQAKAFFEELPFLFVGARNAADGSVWATTLCGEPGFMKAVDDYHLRVVLKQIYGDPVEIAEGTALGCVGVMLHNRRRNKLNGVVESLTSEHLTLRISHSLGNCPKYIQVRTVLVDAEKVSTLGSEKRRVLRGNSVLGEEQRAFIARADTLFLATSFAGCPEGRETDTLEFCNCNHRGGAPGFAQVSGDGTILVPDYVGNNLYQSLGNILASPNAGLQFIDFSNGDSLQLTGRAHILFDDHTLPGAQRAVKFETARWVHVLRGLPISSEGLTEPSPYNPVLEASADNGAKRLRCVGRRSETHDIETFEFFAPPPEGEGKVFCEAGQFASFDFPDIGDGPLNRTWTISSSPAEIHRTGRFTISVKKAGFVSSWLHDNLVLGRDIIFRGVDGDFTLDRAAKCIPPSGVLLVAAGIGVTPMRVMFTECLQRGYPVSFLYSFRSDKDAAFLDEFREAAVSNASSVRLAVALTAGPYGGHVKGVQTFHGRISAAMIEQVCPNVLEREVFQCGPEPMMSSINAILEGLGLPATRIHQENFSF